MEPALRHGEFRIDTRRWTGLDALVLIGLAGLVAIAFWEVVGGGRVFFFRDFALFFYPKRALVAESLRNFDVPFWTQYGGCGEPVLGTWQVAMFYPPALIYYLLPMPASFMWFNVLHFFIAGAGTYFMMRTFGARRAAAGAAAVAWGFSPAFVSVIDNVSFMNSLAWLPWCLGFMRQVCLGRGFRGFLGLVAAFAMALLAGGPEPVIFIAAAVVLYAFFFSVATGAARGWGGWWKPPLLSFGALGLATVISGVEVVPFLHALRWSGRPAMELEEAQQWAATPTDSLLWFLPRLYLFPDRGGIYWRSQYWLKTVYVGVMVPVLAGWTVVFMRSRRRIWLRLAAAAAAGVLGAAMAATAVSSARAVAAALIGFAFFFCIAFSIASTRRRNIFFALAALLCCLLAVGKSSLLWRIFWQWLPGFSLIRFPVKWFLPGAFAMAVLMGFALDDFLLCARRGSKRAMASLFSILLGAVVLFGCCWFAMRTWRGPLFTEMTPRPILERVIAEDKNATEQAWDQYNSAQWSFGRSAAYLAAGAAALALAGFLTARRIPRPYGVVAFAMVLFVDMAMFGAHLNPLAGPELYTEEPARLVTVPHGPTALRLHTTPQFYKYSRESRLARIYDLEGLVDYISVVKGIRLNGEKEILSWLRRTSAPHFNSLAELDWWLRNVNSPQFITNIEQVVLKETFHPNLNLLDRVPVISSFDPVSPKWHFDIMYPLQNAKIPPMRERYLARMWGVATVIDVTRKAPGFVYRQMRQPGKRARLAENFMVVRDDADALDTLVNTQADILRRIALFPDDAAAAEEFLGPAAREEPAEDAGEPGTVRIISDTGDLLRVEVDAERPVLLFMSDNWYPNFRATVDSQAAPIWRANLAYRAVPVPAGKHVVEFVYRPTEFYVGLATTVLGVVLLFVVARLWRRAAVLERADAEDTPPV